MSDIFIDHVTNATLSRTDIVGSTIYIGKARLGTSEDDLKWSIKKIITTNPIQSSWAEGTASFDKSWTNRTSYTYS